MMQRPPQGNLPAGPAGAASQAAAVAPAAASSADFLVELGTEELPPLALRELETAFAAGIRDGLGERQLASRSIESFATPRRLAVLVRGLALRQPDQKIRRRGPPVQAAFDAAGAPTRAATAFAESCGVAVTALGRVKEGKGEFLLFEGEQRGAATAELLPAIVQASLDALPIPKRMRWGAGEAEFVRPVHWLVMLLGTQVLEARILDTPAGRHTRGHRFHAPEPIEIPAPDAYAALLRERGRVMADFGERRARVRAQVETAIRTLAGERAWRAVSDDELLDEVTALVEWPVGVTARFEDRFLELPREVLISTLQEHQRYFPLEDEQGRLTPWFVAVSNIESRDPARVREGNERVVRPRLADAAFFWEQDRRQGLAALTPRLDKVTYQAKLGSIGDRVRRIESLAAQIAPALGVDAATARRAATLAKCDLLTAMVGEFPDLQGIMGMHYARAEGEPEDVARAIAEHYLPRGAGDALPSTPLGTALAIAERVDVLAGIFAIDQKPTGTKDPFGVRRAAIGLLRLLLEQRLELPLRGLLAQGVAAQPVQRAAAVDELHSYVLDRLRAMWVDGGACTPEQFDAVAAADPPTPLDFQARLGALRAFLERPEATSLTAANRRISNILRKSEGGDDGAGAGVDRARLVAPEEQALHAAVESLRAPVEAALAARDYASAFERLAGLRASVDAFFDRVMVNDPDAALRRNRFALLAGLRALFARIADLSRLPG